MKVFKYDIKEGKRLEQIDDIPLANALSNMKGVDVRLPAVVREGVEWHVFTSAVDRDNKEIKYDFPVCFCLGQMRCGEEPTFWSWCVLLPKEFKQ